MFIVTECGTSELRQEFHVYRNGMRTGELRQEFHVRHYPQTHFTPGGVRIGSDAVAINMQPLRG